MKVYAHRAGNNLSCIHPLKRAGFRTMEGDVMFARDEAIMVHPAGLPKRLPDGNLDYTSGEVVQQLADQGIAVPTLAGMLELIQAEELRLLLEIKLTGTFWRIAPLLVGRKDVTIISFMGDELVQAAASHLEDPHSFPAPGVLMAHAPSADVAAAMLVGPDPPSSRTSSRRRTSTSAQLSEHLLFLKEVGGELKIDFKKKKKRPNGPFFW